MGWMHPSPISGYHQGMDYTIIDNGKDLLAKLDQWNGLERIAVDFEGEFNLHIYGEHLCLIQVYDGKGYYIIDPRANAMGKEELTAFFESDVKKVWFDCQSDNSLVFKKYGVGVRNICDVRIYAMALGHMSNLVSLEQLYLGLAPEVEAKSKKKLQQTNWLRRPLSREQIEYALSDVSNLFALEDVLVEEVRKAGLEEQCEGEMARRTKPSVGKPAWTHLGPWRRMSAEQKESVKQYYLAREAVAKRFNVPSFHVIDKHMLADFALSCPRTEKEVHDFARKASPRFQSQLDECLMTAFRRLRG